MQKIADDVTELGPIGDPHRPDDLPAKALFLFEQGHLVAAACGDGGGLEAGRPPPTTRTRFGTATVCRVPLPKACSRPVAGVSMQPSQRFEPIRPTHS